MSRLPGKTCAIRYFYHASPHGYSASVKNLASVTVDNDNVFGDNTDAQIVLMTPSLSGDATNGFTGTITIGVPA